MKTLLAIVEQGGYPNFTPQYESLGYTVTTATSMRKGLGLLKQLQPEVITAEFIYSPMYSARISNLESLLASLQGKNIHPRLLVFVEKEQQHHLEKLDTSSLDLVVLNYPITKDMLMESLPATTATSS